MTRDFRPVAYRWSSSCRAHHVCNRDPHVPVTGIPLRVEKKPPGHLHRIIHYKAYGST